MSTKRKLKILISTEKLQARIRELADEINKAYKNRSLVVVGVLKGSFIFMADLTRLIQCPLTCDFLRVASYGNRTYSSGSVRIEFDLTQPIKGRNVLLVEDIIDTGLTAKCVIENLLTKKPCSLKICALLKKRGREKVKIKIDYLGFTIPNKFVVGYGLDFRGRYRNLPYIAVV